MQELTKLQKICSETTANSNKDQSRTKVDPPNLETNKYLSADYKVNEAAKNFQPEPSLPNKTNPPPRVYKLMQQSEPNNNKTQPTPRVILLQRSPILLAAAYPKMK